ncbi:MAG: protein-ADP-ribose hydrolase [archaeon]|nr:protein-ADP-ribose hydrolase [archaeon]
MDQQDRREFLIGYLLDENTDSRNRTVPSDEQSSRRLLRSLMNVRQPKPIDDCFLKVQDEYLRKELSDKGTVDYRTVKEFRPGIRVWKGDITLLECDAIVNAANERLTGCFVPGHNCIDNCIHTYAGIQLRNECNAIIEGQGHPEPVGKAKMTNSYNLPCKYILHTVGPRITGKPTEKDRGLLRSCYRSCLDLAMEHGLKSIAFCCISTGTYRYPKDEAAEVAVDTIDRFRKDTGYSIDIVFSVFKDDEKELYEKYVSALG